MIGEVKTLLTLMETDSVLLMRFFLNPKKASSTMPDAGIEPETLTALNQRGSHILRDRFFIRVITYSLMTISQTFLK